MIQESLQVEEAILGSLITYPHNLITINAILKDEYLYHFNSKVVYKAIVCLYEANKPIDMITVCDQIKKDGHLESIGGIYYISTLTRIGDVNVESLEYNCRLTHEKYILRQLNSLGTEMQNASLTPNADCFDIIERINLKITDLINIRGVNVKSVGDIFSEMVQGINEVLDKGLPTGLMSGLWNLDKKTGGWQNGNLVILAARPGMGKTALSLQLAKYPALSLNIPTAFFSMEMTALELVGRLASSESEISSTDINQKKITKIELQTIGARCSKLIDCPMYIDDTASLSISDLRSRAKKLFYDKGIKLIIVDYLQLMRGEKRGNREQEISEISRGLKGLAKELNIPIIALSQLSRECEKREDKRPMLSDLRESGAIEQDADAVAFIFRPAEYGLFPNGYDFNNNNLQSDNLMLIDFAKGRGFQTGEIPLKFYGKFMQIDNYDLSNDMPQVPKLEQNNDFLNNF